MLIEGTDLWFQIRGLEFFTRKRDVLYTNFFSTVHILHVVRCHVLSAYDYLSHSGS